MINIRKGDWIETFSGIKFYPLDPKPEEIKLEDIAHALSMNCRFNGHCSSFYSVAEHSMNVANELRVLNNSIKIQLYGLLHDASEAYLCDIPRPIKPFIHNYKEIEKYLQNKIWEAFNLPIPTEEEYQKVKNMDNLMLGYEGKVLMNDLDSWTNGFPMFNPKTIDWYSKSFLEVECEFIDLANYLLNFFKGSD